MATVMMIKCCAAANMGYPVYERTVLFFCKLNTVCVSVKFPAKQDSVSVTLHTAGSQQVKKTYFNVHSHVIFFFCDHYLLHLDAAVTTELKKHIIRWHI